MRKKKFVITSLALAMAVASAAVAQGSVTQSQTASMTPSKQSNKTPGGVSLNFELKLAYTPVSPPSEYVERAEVHLPKDVSVKTTGLATCAKATIGSLDTAGARAACPGAEVGAGTADLNGVAGPDTAVIVAFNGVPQNGNPVILLHARAAALATTSVLVGEVKPSDRGGVYGKMVDFEVEPLGSGFQVFPRFQTTISKLKLPSKGKAAGAAKKKKKKKKAPQYYLSAKCQTGTWAFAADTDNHTPPGAVGSPGAFAYTLSSESSQACKKVKAKKKKKKK